MSTLEKSIKLLQEMPERKLEAVYMYIRFVDSQTDSDEFIPAEKDINSIIGIAHEYANPELMRPVDSTDISKSMEGFHVLQSFAGTLPTDFDYKKELEEMREEKYARFN